MGNITKKEKILIFIFAILFIPIIIIRDFIIQPICEWLKLRDEINKED
jgi:cell division protein FtsL